MNINRLATDVYTELFTRNNFSFVSKKVAQYVSNVFSMIYLSILFLKGVCFYNVISFLIFGDKPNTVTFILFVPKFSVQSNRNPLLDIDLSNVRLQIRTVKFPQYQRCETCHILVDYRKVF